MRRGTDFSFLSLVLAVSVVAGPAGANQGTSVATSTSSCPVEQATRIKNLDPVDNEVFFQALGQDIKLTAHAQRFDVNPTSMGVKKAKGSALFDWFCFDGVTQRSFGSDKDRFSPSGHAADSQRIPANADCFFAGARTTFSGSQKQPAGADIDVTLTAQAIAPGADRDCFDADTLCIGQDNRFKVEVEWRDFSGQTGSATPFPRTDDSGLFFFFNEENTELLLKVIDACDRPTFNSFWIFYAATTDVEFELTVTDTQSNQSRSYENPLGQPAQAILDTSAFATCP